MAEISRGALFGKLNSLAYRSIESATVFCKLRGNPYVEMAHWVHQILQLQDSDLHRIVRHFDVDPSNLARDLTAALERLPRGNTTISDLSADVEETVERAWVFATLMFGEAQVRTGYLLVGALRTRHLRNALYALSAEFAKVKAEALADAFGEIVAGSPEDRLEATDGFRLGPAPAPGENSGSIAPAQMGRQQALQQFTVDLSAQAREGRLDSVVGRDGEIRQLIDILMRRRQNNPMLVGEAGVGKTAVVEGFALRIARGDVPPALKDVVVRTLDVGLLQAGASMKGEFENRLRQVIDEVQASPRPVILFIDEAHTLVGAGGAAGTSDAANLLKPALARGTLRTIGATTWAEYRKHIEKDPALTRRFQTVPVDEPDEEKAILMMRGVASAMEQHHRVQILDEALEAAVALSHRYIPARQLPDKSVSLLDTACARVAISQHATPAEIDDMSKQIEALETEQKIIEREKSVGIDVTEREARVALALETARARRSQRESEWAGEKALVERILTLRAQLRGGSAAVDKASEDVARPAEAEADRITQTGTASAPAFADAPAPDPSTQADMLAELKRLQAELAGLQGESPLILPSVDYQAVASVVSDWTGIPVGRMVRSELKTVMNLATVLGERVIGQDHAMEAIAKRIQTSRAGLDNPDRPVGVFMLAGTSGVGKTETALALAEALYGGEQNLITINMSEFQEAHTVSTLKGAPPGYVGYGEGGVLTEAVRRKPYSVVLLDEIEKAHPDVHELFFQVFDKGVMEDGEGRSINFRNTLILLTTNVGTERIAQLCSRPAAMPDAEALAKALREPLLDVFPPALLGRLVAIPYFPLSVDMLARIVTLQMNRIKRRVEERYRVAFDYDDEVVRLIVGRCTESESGGRMIDAILTNTMLPAISREFLARLIDGGAIGQVRVSVEQGDFAYSFDACAPAVTVPANALA
ncbi:type VI secretion system ATPase TssH [bacterium M00.F.Ca.ET.228.01.1.1]|uniref:type VI secretion system ATPase TssH n=1 Tax=Paraburkholderia phenoliruptrix TaxID=252970 RepID=UPI001092E060|nr:type VI secretion system ATPase TssH [Paraburkholderia phenoliruptrix]TGP45827.1 type VI secretion system ATPase TssH [bacterium M00.F.Ca.ET.228.01.1.1]TGS04261.1 type VI secretion system ATPase TssH [bacterium M00.F.Ca.ET.191.01.1.1]TGU07120.1 type VI secretion system ATPase TssH [bacterium M00.F.Ca.ET.155.01.1.1]MBW0448512.1 type VI secretion system ATPase TssH [Paraburkholderia phenoliruptrix]MBW9100626.1 type VI secretion system ATPase TssH [Paraburkholderia phenoliruptrix]